MVEEMPKQFRHDKLKSMREACRVSRSAFFFLRRTLLPGVTEKQVANSLRAFFRARGYDRFAFRFIVAFGESAAEPHHWPTGRMLRRGNMAKIDFGVKVRGMCSDITRTFFLGRPSKRQKKVYTAVLKAQEKVLQRLKAGMTGREADAIARNYLRSRGFDKHFIHSLGHGLGHAIHEPPWLSPKKGNRPLRVGEVVTVEPGIYLPKWGGVRIEDMVVVGKTRSRVLSNLPKRLPEIIISLSSRPRMMSLAIDP